ncbi:isochorismatase family cysteine hydrolase [Kribbella sp.]|uniref:cysteine hydrolase family protein n=1 Tax=Kribbella sp. TaxID=1871183 RepID=UPI002D5DC6BA|nr:isochorismatase family cysteine hydrolase [Kribbella sp.]HZX03874.1 isochorismatase family cysteine hydrolase [Kribbella sp.]
MIEVGGKLVLTALPELVDPSRAALVLIDMQLDFVEPGFAFDRAGVDLTMYPPMRPRIAELLAAARTAGALVVHVQMTTLPGGMSESPAQLRFNLRLQRQDRITGPFRYARLGDAGHDFVPELAPRDGELVVPKWRSSGFWGTNLDLLLRSNGIETVVVAGCTTEGCVESTARDAMFNDYYVVIVEDCIASDDRAQHDASMLLMRHRFDVAGSAEVIDQWMLAAGNRAESA